MIIKRKVDFIVFNRVLNTLDFIIMKPEYCPYTSKEYSQELKDRFLKYSIIHFSNMDKISMSFTEEEFAEFNFLEGFAYAFGIGFKEENLVDYVKQLQDKYDDWVKEKPEERGKKN